MKKTACFLLILSAMLAACGETAAPSSETTAAPDTTTAAPETELVPDLPDKTYDGKTFTAYIRDDNYRRESFTVEEATGDVLNDAIFDRTRNVEERFGIDIKTHITSGDALGSNSKSAILAGDDEYQLISAFFRTSITFASEELCCDWNELPYVDLSKPWWDSELQDKIARDEDSLEMLDIIRAARTCDAGYMYLASISGGGAFADIGQQLTQYPDHNFSSYYAIYEESVLEIVKEINELYQ